MRTPGGERGPGDAGPEREAIALAPPVNTDGYETYSWVSPDEKLLLFSRWKPVGGRGESDVLVSHRDEKRGWSPPRNLGEPVNSTAHENCARLSPDGFHLFFCSYRRFGGGSPELLDGAPNIYWVQAGEIEALKSK